MTIDRIWSLDRPLAAPMAIVAVSAGALGVALLAQYVGGLPPCVLCIYQRYAYVAALVAGGLGLIVAGQPRLRRLALVAAAAAFLVGAGIAFFHVGVEQLWWRGTAECQAPALDPNASVADLRKQLLRTDFAACDRVPWSLFGISIAGYNMLASLIFAFATLWAVARGERR